MRLKSVCVLVLLCGLWPAKASADNRFIVRTTLGLPLLQAACNPPLLPPICTVVSGLGDPLGQLFLITSPLTLGDLLNLPGNPLGIIHAEVDQLLSLISDRVTEPASHTVACRFDVGPSSGALSQFRGNRME